MKEALEICEPNFVTKLNHAPPLAWGLLFTKQPLERSEQNFVTKLNHATHLSWDLYCMSMPSPVPGGANGQSQNGIVL